MAVPESAALVCYSCKHEFIPSQRSGALRIFLSYGHDANEELVRRIYGDLKQRGHDVWFDKNDIRPGDDWRRSITDGITKSDLFYSFLSKHSTRDPGVCLDEILIAIGAKGGNIQTVLVESLEEVKPPSSVKHIQWLDMHDWKSGHGTVRLRAAKEEPPEPAVGDAAWEKWYQEKLAEIIRVVESDESRRISEEIKTLESYLKPTTPDLVSDARIRGLLKKELVGRKWLFEAVEKWRSAGLRPGSAEKPGHAGSESGAPSRLFWLMGAPGVGKSAFAAHLAHSYGRATVIGVHFCAYDKPDHRSAPRIIRTLAFQLATRLPDYRKLLLTLPEIAELDRKQTAAELFDYLLANPLKLTITGGRERLLIVIDALDEASGDGRNELVEMLARHAPSLPDWIGLVVTSRPESDVRAPLQGLNPFVLDTATEANRADLREYLHHELAPQLQPRPDADRLVEQILEKSEGVFLYAERFCDDVQRGHLSLDRPEQFPQGLGGIFFQYFQRQFPDLEKFRKDVRPALRAILAAREPLPVEILQRLFNWRDEELRDFTRPLGSLFPVAKEASGEVIKPYHKSLADWLADGAKTASFFVSAKEGHRMLAARGWDEYRQSLSTMSAYSMTHLTEHLIEAGRFAGALALLRDAAWSDVKCRAGLAEELLTEFQLVHKFAHSKKKPTNATDLVEALLCRLRSDHTHHRQPTLSIENVHAWLVYRRDQRLLEEILKSSLRVLPQRDNNLASRFYACCATRWGNLLRRQGKLREAKPHVVKALRILKALGRGYGSERSTAEYEMGYIFFLRGVFDIAILHFDSSAKHAKGAGDVVGAGISQCLAWHIRFVTGRCGAKGFETILNKVRSQFEIEASTRPDALRWKMNVKAHLFDIAALTSNAAEAERRFHALEEDAWFHANPSNWDNQLRGRCALALGRFAEAVHEFRHFLRTESHQRTRSEQEARVYWELGRALRGLNRKTGAFHVWKKGLKCCADDLGNKLWKMRIRAELDA